ncbi:MAG: WD40 repeat domain-containing protein [Candidatus Obscuribacterales bacterium]|nr:WD40 repeat domain-containing protein [Candidatus Obscuribacterales bacterium]
MSLRTISCGHFASVDKVALSRSGKYFAVAGAPGRSLSVVNAHINRKVRSKHERDVTCVGTRTPDICPQNDSRTEVLYHSYHAAHIQRFLLESRKELVSLYMGRNYDLGCIVESPCGKLVAAGSRRGDVFMWDLSNSNKPELIWQKELFSASIHTLAFNAGSTELLIANGANQQLRWNITNDSLIDIHGNLKWPAYAFSCHPQENAFAMGGDGERVWLIDLPFKLEPEDSDTAGDGFPLSPYDLDQAGSGSDALSLRNRIYLPDVDDYRCAYLNSNAGGFVNHLHLSSDWKLLVGGEAGLEVWDLQPVRLLKQIPFPKNTSWRHISSVYQNGEFFVAYDY